jgi:SAM-dependent methyltransferase
MRTSGARDATFDELTCSAPEPRANRMAEVVLQYAPVDRSIRVLDLGCGTGGLIFRLAHALPRAECVGVDISPANIAAANAARSARAEAARVRFETVDYLSWPAEPFDVISADTVLHMVRGETSALAAKLARDLAPGGVLVTAMPYACAFNSASAVVRKALRSMRGRWTDAAILAIGRLLHGRMSDRMLRERVHYMYLPPERVMNRALAGVMAAHGLHAIATHPIANTSFAQLKQRITVLRKES